MKLYKYGGSHLLDKAFQREGYIAIRCNRPDEYNDPFELFLTPDTAESSADHIAYYLEILGELPQMPTTCFSRRPDVAPMWAHYGHGHRGIVIEFDEDLISESIALGYVDDVVYEDVRKRFDMSQIEWAATTLKPRHTYFAMTEAFRQAYFTKSHHWKYEEERRLVLFPEGVEEQNGMMLLYLPLECVTSIALGPKISDSDATLANAICDTSDIDLYRTKIGRSTSTPYFINNDGATYEFDGDCVELSQHCCSGCKEPIEDEEADLCNWCMIDEGDAHEAALVNPFRMAERYGIDPGYRFRFAGLAPIGRLTKQDSQD